MHSGRNRIEPMCVRDASRLQSPNDGVVMRPVRHAYPRPVRRSRRCLSRIRGESPPLIVGEGFAPEWRSVLIDRQALAKIESHIADAVAKGRRIRCGGKRIARMARRTIGPVSSEMTIAQERDIRAVGACDCFDDADRSCMRPTTRSTALPPTFVPQTEACLACGRGLGIWHGGMNTGRMSSEAAPFGRVKQSGIGREGSRHCLEDYLEMKYLCTGGI
ncbi:aldehyde dehydrogenase family protein [Mesorhizobium sp. M0659]|uniref:aldehyde dehydrogenase family protein n=1 Tax=Mesorhizobium sp. M0659 TaxID=2956980 RepID=UPI00333714D5